MIKSRYLKHSAEFQKPVTSRDSSGQQVETWQTLCRKFVDIRPIAVDKEQDRAVHFEVARMELKTRYSSSLEQQIDTNCRVIIKNKAYSIDELGDVFSRKQLSYIISAYE